MSTIRHAIQHCACEWSYSSPIGYDDPFNQIELDVVFRDDKGREWKVPAFWAGEQEWRVRFAPPHAGRYTFRTACSDVNNPHLHGQEGMLDVVPYEGNNPLLRHGPLRVSPNRRYLEHADGTPFFWLGDLWWLGLSKRLPWPDDFQLLAADRVAKGFTVIQLIAGLPCDMPAFDERATNEAGHPWEPGYVRLNPAYFDMADLRVRWLVRMGLVPCLVGAFGFYLPWMGVDKMKQHWRNLIARYGAYPVIWCLAGCGAMPYYLEKERDKYKAIQIKGWSEVARYVRQLDPYHHPITIHPAGSSPEQVEEASLLDVNMLMGGWGGPARLGDAVQRVRSALAHQPAMPVVLGETIFESLREGAGQEMVRILFWSFFLTGARGHTYGAQGLWQFNTIERPFGPSPWGIIASNTPWSEAYRLPGSTHVGIARRLLERYPWWRFENHQEWVEPCANEQDALRAYAAGIPGEVRVIYFPRPVIPWRTTAPTMIKDLEPEVCYRAFYFDPMTAAEYPLGTVQGSTTWQVPTSPIMQDWVLVLAKDDG